jgi:predicted NBD/HSP70 family sugar kinase
MMAKVPNPEQAKIRNSNRRKILHLLMQKRELSKQQISRETGISIPTVSNNIEQLITDGIVEEAGVSISTGGRRPMLTRFIPDSRFAVGVDFASNHLTSSNKIRVALIDLDATFHQEVSFDYNDFKTIREIMEHIGYITGKMLRDKGIPNDRVLGIGFSLPGTVNEKRKILELAPNLSPELGMHDLDFKEYERLFPFQLYVENEANAGAFAELILGTARHKRNLVYLSINRGIGAGIVVRGHLYKGNNKRAGTIGHFSIACEGARCTCGMLDCWEIYAASGALIRNYNKKSATRIDDTKAFLQRLRNDESLALEIWEKYLDYLTLGINNILLCYDPHYIIIGGEISEFGDLLINPLSQRIFIRNTFYKAEDVEILLSTLKENSSLVGAALLPFQRLLYGNNKII